MKAAEDPASPGDVDQVRTGSTPCIVVRNSKQSLDGGNNHIILIFVVRGRLTVEQDGRMAILGPGDGTLCVADRPYAVRHESAPDHFAIRLPRTRLSDPCDLRTLTALRFAEAPGVGRLLFAFACDLREHAAAFDNILFERLTEHLAALLETLLSELNNRAVSLSSASQEATIIKAKAVILAHLHDAALTPARVAAVLNLSPRYLNRLFQREGTSVMRYVWDKRLRNAASELVSFTHGDEPVKLIALRNGFKNASHFSTAFRDAFGWSPSDYRDRALAMNGGRQKPST
ncbi:helix-turn-helix domain-containing protein [Reyranella sp. CPCC 100927]|nr:helix-turn-helix domain-containing protein [Reyranella sp. CPCC 100927]